MRKRMYIKESVIKNRLQNYLYNSGNIENNFIKILSELGVNEDKYVLRNYNTEDSSFDCKCPNNAYKIRLGSEYANGWNYSTIEITHNDLSINYFYYLNSDLVPSLKIRDFSKEINGKKFTEVINYAPERNNINAYIRKIKEGNKEAYIYIVDSEIDEDTIDKKIMDKDFKLEWAEIYNLIEDKDNLEKYLIYYKEDGKVTDLTSFGFPMEDIFHYYENDIENNTKVKIKNRG